MTKQAVRHMPHVTVEQVLRLRERAIELEKMNEKLADCVTLAINGLTWYRDQYPEVWTEVNEEAVQHLEQILEGNDK